MLFPASRKPLRSAALIAATIASPVAAQETAPIPGDAEDWAVRQTEKAQAFAPALADLQAEAVERVSWSKTIEPCAAPPETLRLYGLQPATADRMVAQGIMDGRYHGGWTFYGETGCPETPVLRFLYVAEADGRHMMVVVNRGEVISTPSMMKETSALAGAKAYEAARRADPDCSVESVVMRRTEIAATDRNLSAPVGGARFAGGWSENWRFSACGEMVDVTVRFDADGKGGTTARIAEVDVDA